MNRLPRPLGLTNLSLTLQREYNKENKTNLRRAILDAFIEQRLFKTYTINTSLRADTNKGYPNNPKKQKNKKEHTPTIAYIHTTNIELLDMCIGLGISQVKGNILLDKAMYRKAKRTMEGSGYDKMNIVNTRAIQNWALKNAIGKHQAQSSWTDELKAVARLRGYAPLQLKEANSAIGQELMANKAIFEMANKMVPIGHQTNVQINNHSTMPDTSEKGMMLTTTQALLLLDEKGFTNKPLDFAGLAELHGLNDPNLPNVKATPSDAQGTKQFDLKDLQYINHENRRAEELGIIPNIDGVEIKAKKAKKPKANITINI